MRRVQVDLVCRGACHQAPQFSTGRPMDLQKVSLEDSSAPMSGDGCDPGRLHQLIAAYLTRDRLYDFGDKCPGQDAFRRSLSMLLIIENEC